MQNKDKKTNIIAQWSQTGQTIDKKNFKSISNQGPWSLVMSYLHKYAINVFAMVK